jgi:Na+/H+ antiporter NhaD/arsenite permease-like protein
VFINFASIVTAFLLLKPIITGLSNQTPAWFTLASSSTIGGNLTLLGSVANIIVAESTAHTKVPLTF